MFKFVFNDLTDFFSFQSLLNMHEAASKNSDAHLCDFLEAHFLEEQVCVNELLFHKYSCNSW